MNLNNNNLTVRKNDNELKFISFYNQKFKVLFPINTITIILYHRYLILLNVQAVGANIPYTSAANKSL